MDQESMCPGTPLSVAMRAYYQQSVFSLSFAAHPYNTQCKDPLLLDVTRHCHTSMSRVRVKGTRDSKKLPSPVPQKAQKTTTQYLICYRIVATALSTRAVNVKRIFLDIFICTKKAKKPSTQLKKLVKTLLWIYP